MSEGFPLRGFGACAECDTPLTSCWSQSKTGKKHPCYMHRKKGCASYRKSLRRDRLEGEFEDVLEGLQPTQGPFRAMALSIRAARDGRMAQVTEQAEAFRKGRKSCKPGHSFEELFELAMRFLLSLHGI